MRRAARGFLIVVSILNAVAGLICGALLLLWCGFELIFMPNILAVVYFVIGLVAVGCSTLLLKPTPASV